MAEAPKDIEVCIPSIKYCTDNAAMIACAGYFQYMKNPKLSDLRLNAKANLELESM